MSIWTHVSGIIRLDGRHIEVFGPHIPLVEVFGITCDGYKNGCRTTEEQEACPTPCGSEGSLQWETTANESVVYITADLRDYDDIEAIIKWFTTALSKLVGVRQSILLIGCGDDHKFVYSGMDRKLHVLGHAEMEQ